MIGNRPSSLPIARYCGLSAALSEKVAIREAYISQCFHAQCAFGKEDPKVKEMWALLDDRERAKVAQWHRPADVKLSGEFPVTLEYDKAEREVTVAVKSNGQACRPDDPEALTQGTLDMRWLVERPDGVRVVYVGDIKRSEFTTFEGPDSLQLLAYAFASADELFADFFVCGIWGAIEGQWQWGKTEDLAGERAADLWSQVKAAALNKGERPITGAHCQSCWGRMQCDAWTLPYAVRRTEFAALAKGGEGLNRENIVDIILCAQRDKQIAESVLETCGAWVEQPGNKAVDVSTGKKFAAINVRGREYANVGKLREGLGGEAERYIGRARDSVQHKWVKA